MFDRFKKIAAAAVLALVLTGAGAVTLMDAHPAHASTPAADAALVVLKAEVNASALPANERALLASWLTYAQTYFANGQDYQGCQALNTFRILVGPNYWRYYPGLEAYASGPTGWIAQVDNIKTLVPC